jgi:hypothetical protein
MVASMKGAAERGSSMRGSDTYALGDFSAGAAVSTREYVTRNSGRLLGAGGSAAGMIAGAAIAGPIGLVAGSFIGGNAAKMAVSDNTDHNKKLPADPRRANGIHSRTADGANHSQSLAMQNEPPDLLNAEIGDSGLAARNLGAVDMATLDAPGAQATWIGDVSASSQPAVMVQARVVLDQGIRSGPQGAAAYSQAAHPLARQDNRYDAAQIAHTPAPYNGTMHGVTSASGQPGVMYASAPYNGTMQGASVASGQPPASHQQGHPSYRGAAPNAGAVSRRDGPDQRQPTGEDSYRFGTFPSRRICHFSSMCERLIGFVSVNRRCHERRHCSRKAARRT